MGRYFEAEQVLPFTSWLLSSTLLSILPFQVCHVMWLSLGERHRVRFLPASWLGFFAVKKEAHSDFLLYLFFFRWFLTLRAISARYGPQFCNRLSLRCLYFRATNVDHYLHFPVTNGEWWNLAGLTLTNLVLHPSRYVHRVREHHGLDSFATFQRNPKLTSTEIGIIVTLGWS